MPVKEEEKKKMEASCSSKTEYTCVQTQCNNPED
jgi:hypothetical protein